MKNLKVYRKAFAILTVSTLVLMSGCGKTAEKKKEEKSNACTHITVYFEDEPITFKECEGYSFTVFTSTGAYSSDLDYTIKKDGKTIIENGDTNLYNMYEVYHDVADEIIDNESVQKTKIKLNK